MAGKKEEHCSLLIGDNSNLVAMSTEQATRVEQARGYCLSKSANWTTQRCPGLRNNRGLSNSMSRLRNNPGLTDVEVPITELASTLAAGFEVTTNNNSGSQGGHGNEAGEESAVHLPKALWTMSFLIMIMATAAAVHKPASGMIFGDHKKAYYITLAASGVAEAITASWVSRSRNANKRRFSFGRLVLLASIMPFVIVSGIWGYA